MGKRFDFDSIKARMLEGLRKKSDWALILGNGTVGNLIDVIAESEAEDARYLEHLFRETKWETAQSISSLQAQSSLISYKRQLPQSALGYVIMSHTDNEGKNRLSYYGQYFFDIDCTSDYDDMTKDDDATEEAKHALVPWVNSSNYIIPKGTRFISSSGIEYFSTESASSRSLNKAYSMMNDSEKEDFEKRGGWKGIKYLKIPVMQGIQRTVSIGKSSSTVRFQSFVLPTTDVEAASNSVSSSYFYVYVIPENSSVPIYFTEIDHLSRATSLDYVFEKSILKDESGVKIKFGDGISGAIPPDGIVYVHYVETLGSKGDITSKYQINQFILPSGYSLTDPRSDSNNNFLNVTNISTIEGGKDIEDVDDFRKNAPTSYLQSYTISTTKNYLNAILKYSPISLLHCKIFLNNDIKSTDIDYSTLNSSNNVLNKIISSSNTIYITAMQSNGELIPDSEVDDKFLSPLLSSIKDIKSPSDKFSFIQPNLIRLVPSIKVYSSSFDYSQSDISDYVKEIIANEYDIFNQDFNEPLYESKIISLAKTFKFSDNVSVMLEATANIDYSGITAFLGQFDDNSEYILKIPFSFDSIYMNDNLNKGFKDCRKNSDYLIKIDMKFINDASKQDKNRTFFLYDNRIDESGDTSIFTAKTLLDTGNTDDLYTQNKVENYFVLNKTNTNINNRQCKVAQYNYIDKITDESYMNQLKDFSQAPVENLPFEVDSEGSYKTYQSVSSINDYTSIGNLYYKNNNDYIEGVDIDFTMNENDNTLSGYFFIPIDYFEFSSISSKSINEDDYPTIISLLKQYVDIEIYAQPLLTDFNPQNVNDIIYIDKDYMKVEKELIS